MSIRIGPFVVGEKPATLEYQFLDADGNPLPDITGYAATFCVREQWGTPVTGTASVTNGPQAKVQHTWTTSDFTTPGHYRAEFWIGNGTNRFASEVIEFDVRSPVCGTPPAI